MALELFNPFENLYFSDKSCFLSGEDLTHADETLSVFPEWILDRFDYRDRKFTLMDTVNSTTYGALKLPCSPSVKLALDVLDEEVKAAFDQGYEGMKALDSHRLFLWIGRIVYGVLFLEIQHEQKRSQDRGKEFGMSPVLKQRYSLFHLMLQSLISPVYFKEGLKPWSISIVKLKYSQEVFNHRDDAINLIFSLGINGFGIIACLQDNGVLTAEHQDILDKAGDTELHPIQFEELCARFLYSNYLLQAFPKFDLDFTDERVTIEALPVVAEPNKALFSVWDNTMFEQVLEDYWTPWALTKKDIMNESNFPISFLEDGYTFEFIDPKSISLPY